jgi:hypothetical protein
MYENLCLNKRKNKSAKFSENLNALRISIKESLNFRGICDIIDAYFKSELTKFHLSNLLAAPNFKK